MRASLVRDGLRLVALCGLAVAQPLYDLLGKNPEFFAVRGSGRWAILVFAFAVALAPPFVLIALELSVHAVRPGLRPATQLALVAALGGLLALEVLRRTGGPPIVTLALASAAGAGGALAYRRVAPVRSILTVLAPAPLLFLALFLLTSPASKLILPQGAQAAAARVDGTTPVVLLVLDELETTALLDGTGRIDPVRFPSFASLARGADWYPNATTVHESTTSAVPAILTGRYPRPRVAPVADQYPESLFTLLGGAYRLNVFENQTRLCPGRLCRGSSAGSFGGQLASLAGDAAVAYAHLVLPKRLARRLPSISESWGDFLGRSDDEPARFDRFLSSLGPGEASTLWFVHLLLPHSPWQYLPDGERYAVSYPLPPWGSDEFWIDDAAVVLQNQQRHLLQLGYVDTLLGRLVRRLRETGLFDRALVVVTPDHGIGFRAGHKRRPVWPGNLHEIAFVPLVVKRPGQHAGRVIARHVETVDVLPTIARAVRAHLPWRVDGHPLGPAGPARPLVTVRKNSGERVSAPLAVLVALRARTLRRQVVLFGSGERVGRLYGLGRYRRLLGRRIGRVARLQGARVSIADAGRLRAFNLAAAEPVVQVHGRVTGARVPAVAVGVNGLVAAVVPAFAGEFWALIPRASFRDGANLVEVLAPTGPPSAPQLRGISE